MMSQPPIEKISIYALILLLSLFAADLGLMFVRGDLYPRQPPPAQPLLKPMAGPSTGNLAVIKDRNIFNSDGKIPPALGEANATNGDGKTSPEDDPEPIPSTLDIQLAGTIVHANPERSIATVNVKAKNEDFAVKVGDTIPENLGKVLSIERRKLVFRNTSTGRREYIEMKEEGRINFGQASNKPVQQGEVLKKSDTDFELKRNDINRLTNNLPELLQQARAVPRMGPGGMIECFNLADIASGSIYERLGLKRGDCIKSVNGEKIDSPAKAMELYNALRSSANTINLGFEREGKDVNNQYTISQ